MTQAKIGEVLQHFKPLSGRDIPIPSFLYLCEYPWLDQRAASNHDRRHAGGHPSFGLLPVGDVSVTNQWQLVIRRVNTIHHTNTSRNVLPICFFSVALQTRSSVELR